jgi:hypothetical protein
MDELEDTLNKLENEVMEELDGEPVPFKENPFNLNPMTAYKIEFPYSVRFTLSDDDHRTEVVINSISQEMTFARPPEDALFQKEKNDAVSKNGYTNHIVKWVRDRMSEPHFKETCELEYTDDPIAKEMTEEEVRTYEREVISID